MGFIDICQISETTICDTSKAMLIAYTYDPGNNEYNISSKTGLYKGTNGKFFIATQTGQGRSCFGLVKEQWSENIRVKLLSLTDSTRQYQEMEVKNIPIKDAFGGLEYA